MSLTWIEQELTREVAGALNSLAELIRQRPERAEVLRAAVIAALDERGHVLVAELTE